MKREKRRRIFTAIVALLLVAMMLLPMVANIFLVR